MDEFEQNLTRASQSLTAFVEQTGLDAVTNLEQAFSRAGNAIEHTLSQAAQSSELNFRRMTEAILTDLARIAAESVIAQSGIGPSAQMLNVNLRGELPGMGSRQGASNLETLIAAAARRGTRYA